MLAALAAMRVGGGRLSLGVASSVAVPVAVAIPEAGTITGLLGRGADPDQAAAWGSYVHAAAGDRLLASTAMVVLVSA